MNEDCSEQDAIRMAKERCLKLLLFQDRTEKQLMERLLREGFTAEAAESALSYARSLHYIDDSRFARQYVMGRISGKGSSRIRAELREKGVPEAETDILLEEFREEEEKGAFRTAEKLSAGKELSDPRIFHKLLQAMLRRGYSLELSRKALKKLLENQNNS